MFGGNLSNGSWYGTYIGKEGKGLRLSEHEKYETTVYLEDLSHFDPEGNLVYYVDFWFENTLGQRYKVKKSEKLIKQLSESANS